jgi:hypothetical protein
MAGTYGDLKARIARDLVRDDLTTDIENEIASAIVRYQSERFWFNEALETATMTAGQANFAVPVDMAEIDQMTITYGGHPYELERREWDWYRAIGGDDANIVRGVPTHYVYYANQFWWYPVPDDAYPIKWSGVKKLAALSADADSNEWTVSGEELIRARARQAVRINRLQDQGAIALSMQMASGLEPFYSAAEKIAYTILKRASTNRQRVGRLTTDVPTSVSARLLLRELF